MRLVHARDAVGKLGARQSQASAVKGLSIPRSNKNLKRRGEHGGGEERKGKREGQRRVARRMVGDYSCVQSSNRRGSESAVAALAMMMCALSAKPALA